MALVSQRASERGGQSLTRAQSVVSGLGRIFVRKLEHMMPFRMSQTFEATPQPLAQAGSRSAVALNSVSHALSATAQVSVHLQPAESDPFVRKF